MLIVFKNGLGKLVIRTDSICGWCIIRMRLRRVLISQKWYCAFKLKLFLISYSELRHFLLTPFSFWHVLVGSASCFERCRMCLVFCLLCICSLVRVCFGLRYLLWAFIFKFLVGNAFCSRLGPYDSLFSYSFFLRFCGDDTSFGAGMPRFVF